VAVTPTDADIQVDSVVETGARPLTADRLEELLGARGDQLEALLVEASALRDAGLRHAGRDRVITYSRKVFIPLTTLCRDRCHYCIFVDTPGQLLKKARPVYMSAEQVLAVARQGVAAGCKEALLTLGDRPEDRWPEAKAWLDEHGYASTIDYVIAMARLITAETGLLAHANPGVMSLDELHAMREVAPSMGMMLETTSRRLYEEPGQVHFGSPDKDPELRLRVIEDAGRARVPFTTGILVGIGETVRDRAESILAIRDAQERHGHIQEVIVQNFRAKPQTAMADAPDATLLDFIATIATTRLVMGPDVRIQVPPNLSDTSEFGLILRAGVDDWGGVSPLTADHVNPERPWPHLDELADRTASYGFELRERLTAHPEYVLDADEWIDEGLRGAVADLANDAGLADVTGSRRAQGAETERPTTVTALTELAADPLSLDDREWERLLLATGDDLESVVGAADAVRRFTVGEAIGIVVNRTLDSSRLRSRAAASSDEFTLSEVEAIARDAWAAGATELTLRGTLPHSESPDGYPNLAAAVKRAAPGIHLRAFRPEDVRDFAAREGRTLQEAVLSLRDAGVDGLAEVDLSIDGWRAVLAAAHRVGFGCSAVLGYGRGETAADVIRRIRELRAVQDDTRTVTELIPTPLGEVPLVSGRAGIDEHRAVTAVARLMLSGSIPHIQAPWEHHSAEDVRILLGAGADDLGGTRLAGAVADRSLPLADAARLAKRLFRPLRQRTSEYGEPSAERKVAGRGSADREGSLA
jgi:FO synthase